MKLPLVVIGVIVAGIICASVQQFAAKRTVGRLLQLIGAICLGMVVLAHLAEALHVFTRMGWGERHSVGHYLDLTSAIGGILLPLGYTVRRLTEREKSN